MFVQLVRKPNIKNSPINFVQIQMPRDTLSIDQLIAVMERKELCVLDPHIRITDNKKRSHTQLDSRKQVIAFQDRVIAINIKEAQHPLK